jgi:Protein of unknown function (DUF3667)
MTNCRNCNRPISENYCPHCGQVVKLKRIDKHYLEHEFLHLFHLEKGFVFTVMELVTNPGQSIRAFISDNRNKLMKPVPFLIFTSLLYTLVGHFFNATEVDNSIGKIEIEDSHITIFLDWLRAHYGYANIAVGFFIAFCIKLFFKKYSYNFFEIMTMLCYVLGQNMLAMAILACFYNTLNTIVYRILFSVFVYGYSLWAIGQFFDKTKVISYIKAATAFILGYLLYFLTIAIVGISTDYVLKWAK